MQEEMRELKWFFQWLERGPRRHNVYNEVNDETEAVEVKPLTADNAEHRTLLTERGLLCKQSVYYCEVQE